MNNTPNFENEIIDDDLSDNETDYIVRSNYEGLRLDKFLSDNSNLTRSAISKLIERDMVSVNGKVVKSSYKVKENDTIKLTIPQPKSVDILKVKMDLNIAYEDDDLLIINKPKGLVVHPSCGHENDTLVNGLMYYLGDNLSSINGILRPGIVHRIDKDTSGLLIICKNDKAHNFIASKLETHDIKRTYHAIVKGNLTGTGTIDTNIGRNPKDRKKMAAVESGKRAITHYEVLKNFKGYTYIKCNLETGRTHQIRVHMSSIGHPILGDELYGGVDSNIKVKTNGQCLHAKVIEFEHPTTHEMVVIDSDLPQYFVKVLTFLEKL